MQRWRINQEICYRYWCTLGTDCARCVAVCPYSHDDNAMHNMVRGAVQRSGAARRAVLWLDHVFYGAEPKPKPAPPPAPVPDPQPEPAAPAKREHESPQSVFDFC